MARYRLTGPDGKTYEVTAPADASEDQVLSYFRSNLDKATPAKQSVGIGEGFGRQALDTFTFGVNDMASAALKTPFGGTYQENLARERARTKAATEEPISAIAGRTAGMTGQGVLTMPLAAGARVYQGARSALEPVSRPLGQAIESGVGAIRNALMTPAQNVARNSVAAAEVAEQAARPAQSALASWAEGLPGAIRYGAAFGGADAAGHASGGIWQQVRDTGEGMVGGAILGPAFYSGMAGAGNLLSRHQLARQRRADAVAANVEDARAVGISDPLGPAMANGIRPFLARGIGAGIGGKPVGDKAAANVAEWQASLNRTLSNAVDGKEAGDLGKAVQQDLRRALVNRSISSEDIGRMSRDDLEAITGPVAEGGFAAPRPRVDPVAPRSVDPIEPRAIGPEPAPPPSSQRIPELEAAVARKEQEIAAFVAEHNKLASALTESGTQSKKQLADLGINNVREYDGRFYVETPSTMKMSPTGRLVRVPPQKIPIEPGKPYSEGPFTPDQYLAIQREIARQQKFDASKAALDKRVGQLRQIYAEQDEAAAELARVRAAAESERVGYEQARTNYEQARTQAQAEAADATARAREQATREAQEATRRAQVEADTRYQEELASGRNSFQAGRSRESYPTEFDAAYETVQRVAPKAPYNPLGTNYTPTNTSRLLQSVADEAKRTLRIRDYSGDVFGGEGGSLDPGFNAFLRSRIGDDFTRRLADLAESRAANRAVSQEATRRLYSDLGRAAREAEKPQFPAQPRPEDAALMKRLQGALKRDFYDALASRGRAPRFTTQTADYDVTPSGSTASQGRAPSDVTYYVTPENAQRLNRGAFEADRMTSWPATTGIRAERNQIGRFSNVKGEFDRSTLVPFSDRPDPGLVPVQVWSGGHRVQFGSPIASRAPTEGERAVAMFKNVDEGYQQYITELRRPLAKIFGDNVEPVQAMDRLVKAAMKGETSVVGAYARVMREKSDPTKGAAAVLHHMSNGGRDMSRFLEAWREMPAVSKRALFQGKEGQQLGREMERFVRVGERLERFASSSQQRPLVDPSRLTHMATASAFFANAPAVVAMIGGNAAVARMLSSPRYLRWISETPDAIRGGFQTPLFRRHMERLSAIGVTEDDQRIGEGIGRALVQAFSQGGQK